MGAGQSTLGLDKSKVKSVIGLKKGEPEYRLQEVVDIISNGPAKSDTKVFVICISGDYRSGKSFLLNLLVTYMTFYCQNGTDNGWTARKDMPIKGGKWAPGEDAVTKGIWMFVFPKLINGKAIILMDCQGSKDTMYSSPTLDNLILFLGLQLSDVHMLNVTGTIKATDYDRLDLCVYHAEDDEADDESNRSLFERHIFLVRDWGNPNKPKSIDQVIQQTQSEPMKKAAMGIKQAFRVVENESLPYPGRGVIGRSEGSDINIGDVCPDFLKDARALFHKLTIELPTEANRNCGEFLTQFEFVSKRAVGKISTPQQAYEESLIKEVFKESSTYFKAEIAKLENLKRELTEEQMQERITAAYDEAVRKFTNNRRVQKCDNQQVAADYLGYLKSTYKECIVVLGKACVVEKLTKEVEERKKNEAAFKQRLKSVEEECRKARTNVRQMENEVKQANELKDKLLAEERRKTEQRFKEESERRRAEQARFMEELRAERERAAHEERLRAEKMVADEKERFRAEQARLREEAKAERERAAHEERFKAEQQRAEENKRRAIEQARLEAEAKAERDRVAREQRLRAAQEIADEKERLRKEQARLAENATAEREKVSRERQRKADELEERLKNPPIGDAILAFGKSVINNTVGRLFGFRL